MKQAKGYSLWLMPSGKTYKKLASIINQLSKKYLLVNFSPHITLIGEVRGSKKEIISKTKQLACLLQPYKIKLTRVDQLKQYFRSLFIRIKETKKLMAANTQAREIFNRHQDPQYMPHLSLAYGQIPFKIKREIIKNIGSEFNISFKVNHIHLFSTKGEPQDWYKIKTFPLRER